MVGEVSSKTHGVEVQDVSIVESSMECAKPLHLMHTCIAETKNSFKKLSKQFNKDNSFLFFTSTHDDNDDDDLLFSVFELF
jgi:hypothetical protein